MCRFLDVRDHRHHKHICDAACASVVLLEESLTQSCTRMKHAKAISGLRHTSSARTHRAIWPAARNMQPILDSVDMGSQLDYLREILVTILLLRCA